MNPGDIYDRLNEGIFNKGIGASLEKVKLEREYLKLKAEIAEARAENLPTLSESELRDKYPAAQEAWDQYKTIINLLREEAE
jgi:hypothetical protein